MHEEIERDKGGFRGTNGRSCGVGDRLICAEVHPSEGCQTVRITIAINVRTQGGVDSRGGTGISITYITGLETVVRQGKPSSFVRANNLRAPPTCHGLVADLKCLPNLLQRGKASEQGRTWTHRPDHRGSARGWRQARAPGHSRGTGPLHR